MIDGQICYFLTSFNLQELRNLDADKIAAREAEELQKERREQQQKLKMFEKKLDYFERAKRLEEIPLLKLAWKEKQVLFHFRFLSTPIMQTFFIQLTCPMWK